MNYDSDDDLSKLAESLMFAVNRSSAKSILQNLIGSIRQESFDKIRGIILDSAISAEQKLDRIRSATSKLP